MLREREFRLLFTARALSVLGDNVVPVALAFAVLDLTHSASALGLVLAARMGPMVVFLLIGGVWADRLPRQRLMLASDLIRSASQGVAAFVLITGTAELWHLLVLQLVTGSASAFFLPASTGLVPQTVPGERLQQANALLGLTSSTAGIAGPAIAGILVATVGPGWTIAIDAASFLASAACLSLMRVLRAAGPPSWAFVSELVAGWREFRSRAWLWAIDLYAALGNFAVIAPFLVLGPLVAKESLGGASAWALIVAAFGVGEVLGGLTALRTRPKRTLVVGCALMTAFALPLALLAVPAPALAIAAAALLGAFGLTVFNTLFETTLQERIPPEALSRVSAYDWIASLAFLPLGFVVAGPAADAFGTSAALWAAAVWMLVSTVAVLSLRSVRSVRRLDAARADEPSLAATASSL